MLQRVVVSGERISERDTVDAGTKIDSMGAMPV